MDDELTTNCHNCGRRCDTWEVVDTGGDENEIWCWCPACDIETFRELPEGMREGGEW